MTASATIIPIASGKGGVGKSLFTASLAIALAKLGHKTVAVDLDLGGSNLYSYLGLRNDHPGIGDFVKARSAQLDQLLLQTPVENLQFLPGDGCSPLMANISYAQKLRLIRQIKKLPGEYILLDIGAGSSFNTLDFFAMSKQGLLVTTMDFPAIINMMTFLKNLIFRDFQRITRKKNKIHKLVLNLFSQPVTADPLTSQFLYEQISQLDVEMATQVLNICQSLRPGIIFNRGTHPNELKILDDVDSHLKKLLALNADHWGFIFEDNFIRDTTKNPQPVILQRPEGDFAEDIFRIADRISRLWHTPPHNSSQLLKGNSKLIFERRQTSTGPAVNTGLTTL